MQPCGNKMYARSVAIKRCHFKAAATGKVAPTVDVHCTECGNYLWEFGAKDKNVTQRGCSWQAGKGNQKLNKIQQAATILQIEAHCAA